MSEPSVMTVRGLLRVRELGHTQTHEHLLLNVEWMRVRRPVPVTLITARLHASDWRLR